MSDNNEQSNVINIFEARHRLLMKRIDREREELRTLPKSFQSGFFASPASSSSASDGKLADALRRHGSFSGKAHAERFKNKVPLLQTFRKVSMKQTR